MMVDEIPWCGLILGHPRDQQQLIFRTFLLEIKSALVGRGLGEAYP